MRISVLNRISGILLLLTFFNLAGMSSRPVYVTPSEKYHIVQKGDTLSLISRQSGISVSNLKLYNNLKSDRIEIGQKIYYAPHKAGKRAFITERKIPADNIHRVAKGEDLPLIAQMYGLDLLDLVHYNSITSWELEEGEEVYLKDTERVVKAKPKPKPKQEKKASQPAERIVPKVSKPASKPRKKVNTEAPGGLQCQPVQSYQITRRFNKTERHQGIDLAAPAGTPIYAVYDGKVVYAGVQKGYGNLVILEHEDRVMTVYAHNETNIVETGESVKAGEKIAAMGSTGRSSGNHLHFEIRQAGQPVNPEPYLKMEGR
jgi:lipoprotein NlpD